MIKLDRNIKVKVVGILLLFTVFSFSLLAGGDIEILHEEYRHFDTEKIEQLQKQSDFSYFDKSEIYSFWEWLGDKVNSFFNWLFSFFESEDEESNSFNFFAWIPYIIAALGIFFIITNISGIEFSTIFSKKHDLKEDIFDEILDENINELNFEELIAKNIQDKNYRYLIRLYYLQALKQLSDKNLIDWQNYKTNREYFYEIENERTKHSFGEITKLFNYVWYGHFEISEENYKDFEQQFTNFSNSLNQKQLA